MIATLLSGDRPRSRILAALLVALFAGLALAPFIFPGTRPLDVAAKVCVYVLLVASYDPLLGVVIGGKFITYYLVFGVSLVLFLALLRVVNSPFGLVLLAIRENDFRAEALGYRTVIYRTIANCLGAVVAALAGVLYALWLRYTGPHTTLDVSIMIDILLMVVIGGLGTMYGAGSGGTLFVIAQNYLQDAMRTISEAAKGVPAFSLFVPDLFHPDRWLLWLRVVFGLSVYYFPYGIVCPLGKQETLR